MSFGAAQILSLSLVSLEDGAGNFIEKDLRSILELPASQLPWQKGDLILISLPCLCGILTLWNPF